MRDLLTVLAALLIAALTAALAAPPLIDWTAHRDLVDRALSQALDTPVVTEGGIDVRLLPSPQIKLERVRVGAGAASLTASFLRAEVALTPLLGGAVHLQQTRIGRAEVRVGAAGQDWRLPRVLVEEVRRRGNWAVMGLSVHQFVVTNIDPVSGRTDQIRAENLTVQAQGLDGPWRVEGTSRGLPFQLVTGELDPDNATSIKLVAGGGRDPRLELDGRLQLRREGDALLPTMKGNAKLVVPLPVQGGGGAAESPLPVTLVAGVNLSGRTAELDPVTVEAGEGTSSLRLAGTGRLALEPRRLALDLKGRRFDLDGFLQAARGKGTEQGPAWPLLPRGRLPVELSLRLDSLALAGEEWTGLATDLALADGRLALRRFELAGPGDTRLTASGELGAGFAAGGFGRLSLSARAPDQLAGVLERVGLAQDFAGLLGGEPIELTADIVAAEPLVSLRNLQLAFRGATLTGAMRYTMAEGRDRARFDAQLALEGLDLRRAPPPAGLFAAARSVDLGLILDARNVSYGGTRGGRIAARLSSEGTALRVDRLEIANLAGANGSVSGRIEPDGTGRIEGRVTAQRAAPLIDLAAPVWIGGLAGLLPPGLRDSSLDLAVSAERADGADGQGIGLRTRLSGTLAGGPFEAETVSAGGELRQIQARLSTDKLRGWVGGPDLPALARPARLTVSGARLPSGHLGLTLEGDLAGVRLRTSRPIAVALADSALAGGAVEIAGDDLTPLAAALGDMRLAIAPARGRLAATLSRDAAGLRIGLKGQVAETGLDADLLCSANAELGGTVRLDSLSLPWLASALALNLRAGDAGSVWPVARFGPAPAGRFRGEVTVKAASLDLSGGLKGSNASFGLANTPDGLAMRRLETDLAGGHLAGEATIARQGGLASLVGGGQVRDLDVAALTGGRAFAGRLSGELRFGGSGESVAGIVANLGGAGTLTLEQLRAARADPDALPRTIARQMKSDDPLAVAKVQAAAAEELDRGELHLSPLSGPVTLVAGVVRATPMRGEAEGAIWSGSVGLDLRNLSLDVRGLMQAKTLPPQWSGDPPALLLGWQGPVSRPSRTLDVGPLVNGLASVVLTRELDRIDTFEADQNERQRRNSQREMERDRRAAAQEAARQAAIRAREAAERERAQALERARASQGSGENAPAPAPAPATSPPAPADGSAQKPEAPPGG